jgi:hypothetical protein
VLAACCMREKIRDETDSDTSLGHWVTRETYHQTYGVNPSACLLSHTYRPHCFSEFMVRMKAAYLRMSHRHNRIQTFFA